MSQGLHSPRPSQHLIRETVATLPNVPVVGVRPLNPSTVQGNETQGPCACSVYGEPMHPQGGPGRQHRQAPASSTRRGGARPLHPPSRMRPHTPLPTNILAGFPKSRHKEPR